MPRQTNFYSGPLTHNNENHTVTGTHLCASGPWHRLACGRHRCPHFGWMRKRLWRWWSHGWPGWSSAPCWCCPGWRWASPGSHPARSLHLPNQRRYLCDRRVNMQRIKEAHPSQTPLTQTYLTHGQFKDFFAFNTLELIPLLRSVIFLVQLLFPQKHLKINCYQSFLLALESWRFPPIFSTQVWEEAKCVCIHTSSEVTEGSIFSEMLNLRGFKVRCM